MSALIRRLVLVYLAAAVTLLAADRVWQDGKLLAMTVRQYNIGKYAKTEDKHIYTIDSPSLQYVVNLGTHKLKTPINDPIRFTVTGEKLRMIDSDGRERSGKIEERIRKP